MQSQKSWCPYLSTCFAYGGRVWLIRRSDIGFSVMGLADYVSYSDARVSPGVGFRSGGDWVCRSYAHAAIYMLKEREFRELFKDSNR